MNETTYGVADLCDRYHVGEHTVLGWIHNGELVAVNVSRRPGGKPRPAVEAWTRGPRGVTQAAAGSPMSRSASATSSVRRLVSTRYLTNSSRFRSSPCSSARTRCM